MTSVMIPNAVAIAALVAFTTSGAVAAQPPSPRGAGADEN